MSSLRLTATTVLTTLCCSLLLLIPLLQLFSLCSTGEAFSDDPEGKLNTALTNFSHANLQKLTIWSQSTADPAYHTAEQLLQYPGGAWEFEFYLNKKSQLFLYREAMDADQLTLYKKDGVLWAKPSANNLAELLATANKARAQQALTKSSTPPGKGWRKVKASAMSKAPYNYTKITNLELLPFLYLSPQPQIIGPVEQVSLNNSTPYYLFKVKPPDPKLPTSAIQKQLAAENPQEIQLWVSGGDQPRLVKARYFWISHPPGGPLYTVNQVTFGQQ